MASYCSNMIVSITNTTVAKGSRATNLLANHLLAITRQLELQAPQLALQLLRRFADLGPALTLGDGLLRLVVETHHQLHHPLGLPDRAELVVVRVAVLLEEVLLEQSCHVQGDLVRVTQRALADQLHDLVEFFAIGQQLLDAVAQPWEVGIGLFVILVQDGGVLGVRKRRVDGGEVLPLGELLVETPEDLHDTEGGGGDGIGEVTTWWRHGTDDGDGTLTLGRAEGLDLAGTLVEGGEFSTQVSGETLISRHLSQTSGNLTQSLGPPRSGISHHGDVHTLVTEVLGDGDTCVDGGLTGGDGHVGGVGDESGALHDGLLASIDLDGQLGEILQHFSHLVASLTTTNVNNDIGVGEFGHRLRNDRLSTSEGAGDGNSTTLDGGEQGVQHTLTNNEGAVGGLLLSGGTRHTNGPGLHHAVLGLVAVELDLEDLLVDGVAALGGDLGDGSSRARREEDLVGCDEGVLVDGAPDIAAREVVADLHVRGEVPLLLAVEGIRGDATGDVDALGEIGDLLEGSLDTVVDVVEQAGAEFDGERLSGSHDGVTDLDTGCRWKVLLSAWSCRYDQRKAYLSPRRPGWWPGRH